LISGFLGFCLAVYQYASMLLKYRLVDLVNVNCMIAETHKDDVTCLMCDTVDDYMKYEQNRLNVVNQVKAASESRGYEG
jgi:hypothetical protein